MPEKYTVDLYPSSGHGLASASVYAAITASGDVHVVGQAFGADAGKIGGDETEYIATVACEYKDRLLAALLEESRSGETFGDPGPASGDERDRLLLALIERAYSGNARAAHDFYAFAESKGIRAGWFRWP